MADETHFLQFVNDLTESAPSYPEVQLQVNLALARFYRERDQLETAKTYLNQTGFVDESA